MGKVNSGKVQGKGKWNKEKESLEILHTEIQSNKVSASSDEKYVSFFPI